MTDGQGLVRGEVNLDQDTKSDAFFEVIHDMVKAGTAKMNVACTGVVRSYDTTTGRARVQPVVRGRKDGEITFRYPIIVNVPVLWPQWGKFSITGQLEPGDFVWLNFADRSMMEWLSGGGEDVTALARRRFDIQDAVAYPGIVPFNQVLANPQTQGLVIGVDTGRGGSTPMRLVIREDGFVMGDGTEDVLTILDDFISAMLSGTYGLSPADPPLVAALGLLQTRLASLIP